MKKYIFPLNFDYSNKLFGVIEYKILFPLIVLSLFMYMILSFINISFFTKFAIFITIFFPIFLLLNTSINHEPFYLF